MVRGSGGPTHTHTHTWREKEGIKRREGGRGGWGGVEGRSALIFNAAHDPPLVTWNLIRKLTAIALLLLFFPSEYLYLYSFFFFFSKFYFVCVCVRVTAVSFWHPFPPRLICQMLTPFAVLLNRADRGLARLRRGLAGSGGLRRAPAAGDAGAAGIGHRQKRRATVACVGACYIVK